MFGKSLKKLIQYSNCGFRKDAVLKHNYLLSCLIWTKNKHAKVKHINCPENALVLATEISLPAFTKIPHNTSLAKDDSTLLTIPTQTIPSFLQILNYKNILTAFNTSFDSPDWLTKIHNGLSFGKYDKSNSQASIIWTVLKILNLLKIPPANCEAK